MLNLKKILSETVSVHLEKEEGNKNLIVFSVRQKGRKPKGGEYRNLFVATLPKGRDFTSQRQTDLRVTNRFERLFADYSHDCAFAEKLESVLAGLESGGVLAPFSKSLRSCSPGEPVDAVEDPPAPAPAVPTARKQRPAQRKTERKQEVKESGGIFSQLKKELEEELAEAREKLREALDLLEKIEGKI